MGTTATSQRAPLPVETWRPPLASEAAGSKALEQIAEKVLAGERITTSEALTLHEEADLLTLGRLADAVRWRINPEPRVTYIVDRNINPTNVCVTDCGFCAFYRSPKHAQAYVLEREEIFAKVRETVALGGQQLLMQGGHHPTLKTDWWCDLLRAIKGEFDINPHALSAPEVDHLTRIEKRSLEDVLGDLMSAGLGSLPGGGAEMLVERVRRIIAPRKTSTDRWLEVHRVAHGLGLRSSATMMYGNVETSAERIEHLDRLRELQDETGGFTAYACWNTQPAGVPEEHLYPEKTTPAIYLRVLAVSRIFLDNFQNIQTSYVTQGLKLAQVSLRFGCNDFGGTMLEENVVSAAGCFHLESVQAIEKAIERAGLQPLQRNSWYGIVDERFDGPCYPSSPQEAARDTAPVPRGTDACQQSRP